MKTVQVREGQVIAEGGEGGATEILIFPTYFPSLPLYINNDLSPG